MKFFLWVLLFKVTPDGYEPNDTQTFQAALTTDGESKVKFFSPETNSILLEWVQEHHGSLAQYLSIAINQFLQKVIKIHFPSYNLSPVPLPHLDQWAECQWPTRCFLCQYRAAVSRARQPGALQSLHTPGVLPALQQRNSPQTREEDFPLAHREPLWMSRPRRPTLEALGQLVDVFVCRCAAPSGGRSRSPVEGGHWKSDAWTDLVLPGKLPRVQTAQDLRVSLCLKAFWPFDL